MTDRSDIDLKTARARLRERHDELVRLHQSGAEDRAPVELDQTRVGRLSRMDALQVQAMAVATDQRREQELKRIDVALQRIEAGDYGYCITCDEESPAKRLELDPAAVLCVDCATDSAPRA